MEPAENFGEEKKRMEIKINVVGLLIYSSDEEFFEENIHGCWRTRASGVSDPVPRNKIVCYESCSTSFFFFLQEQHVRNLFAVLGNRIQRGIDWEIFDCK